jgi:four helix bundle protein
MFRFQNLGIWQRGTDVVVRSFHLADFLDQQRMYRFAEQVRSASLSITNNIAEGSGSLSNNEFRNFLNIARRSTFETANMCLTIPQIGLTSQERMMPLIGQLDELSRMILEFHRQIPRNPSRTK